MRSDPGKRCSRCRQVLALDAFAVRRASPDGRQSICRACSADYARQTRPRRMTAPPTVPAGKKWCRRCETVRNLDDFAAHSASKDERQTYCRACFAEIYRERRVQQGHVVRPAEVPAGHKFCRSCQQVKPLADWATRPNRGDGYHFRCQECISRRDRERHLASAYGLTIQDVDELLAHQNGICVICLRSPAVHVDHDHATGEVRGMLCFPCNAALGQLDDDLDRLRRAADYLEGRKLVMRRTHPGVVEITYPEQARSSPSARRLAPPHPPIDIDRLRELARLAPGRHAG